MSKAKVERLDVARVLADPKATVEQLKTAIDEQKAIVERERQYRTDTLAQAEADTLAGKTPEETLPLAAAALNAAQRIAAHESRLAQLEQRLGARQEADRQAAEAAARERVRAVIADERTARLRGGAAKVVEGLVEMHEGNRLLRSVAAQLPPQSANGLGVLLIGDGVSRLIEQAVREYLANGADAKLRTMSPRQERVAHGIEVNDETTLDALIERHALREAAELLAPWYPSGLPETAVQPDDAA